MTTRWFEKSYRRNLVDMHINDDHPIYMSQYDPITYVDNLVKAGVDTAILYAGSCLGICYWPTKVGHMHKGLNGRDILQEVIAECRHKQLNVNVYFNIWSRWAYDTHPDWRYRDSSGKGVYVESSNQRYGLCCTNTSYFDYVRKQVEDLSSHYDMDGFWVDMIGWFGGICFCDSCKARYRRETGKDFPEKIDWRDPDWRLFQKHREQWFAEFTSMIRSTVLENHPGCSVVFQSASWSLGWNIALSEAFYKQSDYLAGDFYGDPVEQSFVCKYLDSLTENKPIEFMTSRCPTLYEHTAMKQPELLETQAFASIANNACFVFIDAINPDGTVNPSPYPIMGEILKKTALYEPYLGPHLTRLSDIAIYTDIYSLATMKDNGRPIGENAAPGVAAKRLFQIAETLIHHHLPYDVATRKDLAHLDRFQVLILPDAMMLDETEAAAIRQYVLNGGHLYASKDTSLIHGDGNYLLSDVFGASWTGETKEQLTFMTPAAGFDGLLPFSRLAPVSIQDSMNLIKVADDVAILATITLPYTPPNDAYSYSSAISNPPGILTEWPALIQHTYGKGSVIYSAGCLEAMPHDAHSQVFFKLIRQFATGPLKLTTDAPRPVEITIYDDAINHRLLICCLNFQHDLPNIPIYNMQLSVSLGGRAFKSVRLLPEGEVIDNQLLQDAVQFKATKLETFLMFAIEYE